MSDLDRLIKELQLAREKLGRTPRRPEFLQMAQCEPADIIRATGGCGYQRLVELSGLKYAAVGKRDKQELRRQAYEHLVKEVEAARVYTPPPIVNRALFIGDLHVPYQHPDAIDWLIALDEKFKFDFVGSVGDELDYHAINFHTHDPDALSPGYELEAAIKMLQPLYQRFPNMSLVSSNHGDMMFRKAKHHGLPARAIRSYGETIGAPPGWTWAHEVRVQLSTGQRLVVHHSYSSPVLQSSQRIGENLICGHKHNLLSVEYWNNADRSFFAAQSGCLIDDKALAFAYNKGGVIRPALGSIAVINGIPVLLPMFLDSRGRWNGRLP